MNFFDKAVAAYIGEDRLRKIHGIKVGIAGAGGLGSNCAFNLVRSGFRKLKIVDFDVVESSNLNRQFYFSDQVGISKVKALSTNLKRINPDLELEVVNERITGDNAEGMFGDCDVVVEAFDRAEAKAMIVEKYYKSGKFLVSASGLAGWGNSDIITTRMIHPNFYIIGDLESEVSEMLPPASPRVNLAAAKQADVILNWVINEL
ncbi:MAG: sulfur carrier protein ThiS adenylyltransferase ThiF [Clostridia bacterium]|nr:sulfur carrier protein ThiS adenylyltransferase ThiF [Clostridia bacterium]